MIRGSTAFTPHVIEYLPEATTTGDINQGYSTLVMNKIEEMEKAKKLVTASALKNELHVGKTTVLKHLKRFVKEGFLTMREAKIQYENNVVITPVYKLKKGKNK